MRIAILDPFAGISGDMLLGAMIDAGADPEWLRALPGRIGFPDVKVKIDKVERCSITCTKVDFAIPPDGDDRHGKHIGELIQLVERAGLHSDVRARAVEAFRLVGEAEARVHGTTPERVHLHEVGAIDAFLDIVGGVWAVHQLGIDQVYHLPVAVGTGWVDAAHGALPIPAPATALILEGIETRANGPVHGEATTPTGAALLRVLSGGEPPPGWRLCGVGWGAGTRDPEGYPNALRIIVAEGAAEANRSTLRRHETSVELDDAVRVRIKVWESPGGPQFEAEFRDVVQASQHLDLPAVEIARKAEVLARAAWTDRDNGSDRE